MAQTNKHKMQRDIQESMMSYKPDLGSGGREAVMALSKALGGVGFSNPEACAAFRGRLPARSAEAFVAAGLDAPERLLFMSKKEMAALPGIGAAAVRDAEAYKARFVPTGSQQAT
ncbi:hypothetical protein MKK75_03860 [Methylobacterium sp. J-030]|uniref:hypothetical protein n=1 Tax=Methylobacterium sp. J-030 TaxID=2836627 RepID=UPI001FB8EB66|nr:hypothetical protein [Methylobacterium sp. J-030]MCJ2067951.1 hypothetical protein [Methylobacterium sp. J-030]